MTPLGIQRDFLRNALDAIRYLPDNADLSQCVLAIKNNTFPGTQGTWEEALGTVWPKHAAGRPSRQWQVENPPQTDFNAALLTFEFTWHDGHRYAVAIYVSPMISQDARGLRRRIRTMLQQRPVALP